MLDRTRAALLVIDIQDKLLERKADHGKDLIAKTVKLIACARELGLPVIVTEQNPERLGGTNAGVMEALGDVPRHRKLEFGCLENGAIRGAIQAAGREQLLLTGIEAHICVMQTALGAQDAGFTPYVVRDAIGSIDAEEYAAGLARMDAEGVPLVTTQMAIYELLRAAGTPEFRRMLPHLK